MKRLLGFLTSNGYASGSSNLRNAAWKHANEFAVKQQTKSAPG